MSPVQSTCSLEKSQPEPVAQQSELGENEDSETSTMTTATATKEEAARERRLVGTMAYNSHRRTDEDEKGP